MEKMGGIVCDCCRKFVPYNEEYITVKGKKRQLQYCSEECKNKHHPMAQSGEK